MIFLNAIKHMTNSSTTRITRRALALRTLEFIKKRQKTGIKIDKNNRPNHMGFYGSVSR